MAEVKGVLLNAQTLFLKNHYTDDELERAKATLQPEAAALLKPRYLDSAWYTYDTSVALRHLMRALPPRQERAAVAVGAFVAEHAYTGVYQSLLSKEAAKIVANMRHLHTLVYRDFNTLDAQMSGERSCAIIYRYEADGVKPARAICASLIGFWGRVLELGTGTKVSGGHPACVCEGAERCEFTFSW